MAGNVRFESSSASPEELAFSGNYPNGLRGNYSISRLDRSGSFREVGETRMLSSGNSFSNGNVSIAGDIPLASQLLMLDPITIGDQKYTRSGELRRALGISFGSNAEDNSFGAAHSKPPPPAATEELKRFKASILDDFNKSRIRKKKFDECLYKLNKFSEALSSVKQQQNEMLINERSGGPNLLKMVNQIQRNSQEFATQRMEDRTKNVLKRVRSSIAETRAEGRTNNLARQPLVMGNDRDVLRDGREGSDLVEGKIRRLPAGGEGWDRKMKRKRSAGIVSNRPVDCDTEPKRHYKLNNEPVLQSCDAQSFRSGSSNGGSGIVKVDVNSLSPGSSSRAVLKNELEKVSILRDVTSGLYKERLLAKGNNKLNIREDNSIVCPSPVTKAKSSRGPRTGPAAMTARSLSNFPRAPGSDNEGWEQTPIVNKVQSIGGLNNRKRPTPMSTGSPSSPMAQWAGQRPQKISRTRRANLVSPVSDHDEVHISSEGCSPLDFGTTTGIRNDGPPLPKGLVNGNQQFSVKYEKVSSPAKLSESEESGAGENHERLKGKVIGGCEVEKPVISVQNACSVLLAKKNKMVNKEELGDGVRKQGRSGRGSSFARVSFPPTREKLENLSSIKPPRSSRPGPDKNGSKSGRPLKKLLDRKAFTRLGHMPGSSPDTGDSDDDREELLAAASFGSNASYLACSGSFWKKMEPIFTNVSLDDTCYLRQQMGDMVDEEKCISQCLGSEGREKGLIDQPGSESTFNVALFDSQHGILSSKTRKKIAPLYQRVLSALIVEDEIEEFEDDNGRKSMTFLYSTHDSFGSTVDIDNDPRFGDKFDFNHEPMPGLHTQKQFTVNKGSCNGSTMFIRTMKNQNALYEDDLFQGDQSYISSENVLFPEVHGNRVDAPPAMHTNACGVSSFDHQYEHMCVEDKLLLELQSIGLSPETVPDLTDGEEDEIDKEIAELQKGLHQQAGKRKTLVNKFIKTIEEGTATERRGLEKIGLDRLVEVAYRKLLATRGSSAAKAGMPKVSKQVAIAFMKRTLARCRKFEITGESCFSEPSLRDVLFAVPNHTDDAEPMNKDVNAESHDSQQAPATSGFPANRADRNSLRNDHDFAKTGPISNRGKKKEVLLDDVGGSTSLTGGAKGKRSDRERDKDPQAKNSHAKAGRSPGNFKGERKTKPKPKQQKTAQLSTSGNGFVSKFKDTTHSGTVVTNDSNKKRETGFTSRGTNQDSCKDAIDSPNLQLHELDSIEELGGPQDLSSWLNLDDDGLQDHDSMGLEIPMDDLSDLNMLI